MIKRLLATYFRAIKISRVEFVVGIIALYVGLAAVTYVYSQYLSIERAVASYLVGKSILELLFFVALAPLVIARLRDIHWPLYLAFILFPVWLFGLRNIIIYDAIWNESRGVSGLPLTIGGTSTIVALGLVLVLLFKKSNSSKSLNSDATINHQ